jgi:uncharacterized phage protein (TIGR02218 family)
MKAASGPLAALLDSGEDFVMADLWTLTLSGGSVVRWSGADVALSANGNVYALGPAIERGSVSEKRGLEVATLEVRITAGAGDMINGVPLIPFITRHGLDGAVVRLDRGFGADWASPLTGTVLRFAGKVTSIGEISGSTAKLTVSSWAILLNVNMPPNLYQAGCLHAVYDAGCGLSAAGFAVSGAVSGTATALTFGSGLSVAAGDYAQGRVVFTSGANSGVARAIKANTTSAFTLIQPLPAVPAAGDAFTVYPGCDRTMGRCATRFNNLGRFKGTPFVPPPETSL